MSYKVQFLDDEAFESLPGIRMESKLGVAYPRSGQAYVRRTGINAVDIFNLAHELEHLEGKDLDEHYDAENECYYKDFGNTLAQVGLPVLGGLLGGPVLGPLMGGFGMAAKAVPAASTMLGATAGGAGANAIAQSQQAKQQKSMMGQNQGYGTGSMDMFKTSMSPSNGSSSPNVIQAQGNGSYGGSSGGQGSDELDKIRQQQYGNYSGR